ncbi:hypothetical protein [Campylobacter suis]|uniref:Cytochrome C n=1 Tax=Campylobacter suis TaxID=2790657 RepID=A0ABM8Q761_9BACT|nr:hypothetical protein [Campylobacter suis]CAD7288649.1 hypothetical protein LMG8286_01423 [Campylobacter suis]
MGKILALFCALILFLGCSNDDINDQEAQKQTEEIPADVNISQSETNITIDENLPPEPVVEAP